jgi:NADH-quinone oxidoreductase subunit C
MTREELTQHIIGKFGGRVIHLEAGKYDPLFEIKAEDIVDICRQLKEDPYLSFDYLANLGGVDTTEHFEVVYNLASVFKKLRVDLKVILPYDRAEIDSVIEVWPSANWYERELWELYGINVRNHPNLTRFLLPDDWDQGYPMRKDWDAPDFIRMPER